jgi:hypothetical protein
MPSALQSFRPSAFSSALIPLIAAALAFPVNSQAAEAFKFAPNRLAFGGKALGETGQLTTFLKNTTRADITILSAKLNSKAGYSFTTTCGSVLQAGKKCAYTVKYEPKSLAPASAVLQVATSDPAFPLVKLKMSANLYPMLNDTGITGCGDASQNGLPCPVKDFPRQDAEHGRDATANNDADGHAGFSFTKLNSSGQPLPSGASKWDCVRDNVTGLIWEVKPVGDGIVGNQGLHDADDTYSWYSTDASNNGGDPGVDNEGATCAGYSSGNASTYCNTEAYVNRVNAAGWCGFKDWRMPEVDELTGLVDLSVAYPGPTIDRGYFPDALGTGYWTSSLHARHSYYAWYVGFYYGYSNYLDLGNGYAVRSVRGGQ